MSIIVRMRKQKAVWWERTGQDKWGKATFAAPVEVDCRWDDTTELFVDPQGEQKSSRAIAYVDRVMKVGDRLKRGEMESDTPDDPMTIKDAFEIRRFDRNPNIKATEELLSAFL